MSAPSTSRHRARARSSSPPPRKQIKESGHNDEITSLRVKARQDYLHKREADRVILLRQQVEEEAQEQRMNPHLTTRELAEFEKHRQMLTVIEARIDAQNEAENREEFTMQGEVEASRSETLNAKMRDRDVNDLQLWEEETLRRAKATSGLNEDSKAKTADYDYVFDSSHALTFVKGASVPGTIKAPKTEFERQVQAAEAEAASIHESRKSLPMYPFRDELISAIRDHQCLIVSSETGSGKTTQIPQYILEENLNNDLVIGVTQPRRVAAMSVAARVADEQGGRLGGSVGYAVRHEQKVSEKTKIQFMTDGLLLRELITDPLLTKYGVIMLDEAHERTLSTDILLAFLKDLVQHRQDLKLLISSATMNSAKFSAFLDDCPIFNVPGRKYPVDVMYTSAPEANYVSAAVTTIWQIHISQRNEENGNVDPGDILVFLTGQDDIEIAVTSIEETARKLGNRVPQLIVAPIYSTMPAELQQKIFDPTPFNARKVILATNIAETSITVPGIKYVIDSGLAKENMFNPATGAESLQAIAISKASSQQRAGRAGRVGPGVCFRLYTKHSWLEMPDDPSPEILRSPLSSTVLLLKALGIENLITFNFFDAPSPNSVIAALGSLYELGALATDGRITRLGRQMVEFPTTPELAAAIIASGKFGCVSGILTIVAMLGEAANLFFRPKDKKTYADSARSRLSNKEGGDHLSLLNVYNQWSENEYSPVWAKDNFVQYRSLQRARLVREQLEQLCGRVDIPISDGNDTDSLLKALLSGYFSNTAVLSRDGMHYRTLKSKLTTRIHPSSILAADETRPKVVLYHEVVQSSADWMRQVAPIDVSWLGAVAPHFWKSRDIEKTLAGQGKKIPKARGPAGGVLKK
jgi:pre-mRNA-splicing factor ATP-dependent RNA helicase DHX16